MLACVPLGTVIGMPLGLLHTAHEHVVVFDQLIVAAGGSDFPRSHVVDAKVLADAVERDVNDPEIRDRLFAHLDGFAPEMDRILVTCSTLGGLAESLAPELGREVLRVDRPLARAAVLNGPRIGVAFAVPSTLVPTSSLLWEEAKLADVSVDLDLIDCSQAWGQFLAGNTDGYLASIAATVKERANDVDVVMLAQASMAGARQLLAVDVPVLASPELAVAAALDR